MKARHQAGCDEITFYFTDEIDLRPFNTTKSDRKRGIFKIPKSSDKKFNYTLWSKFYAEKLNENEREKTQVEKILGSDTISMNDFELLKLIGSGGFGKVFLVAKKNTQELFALKVIPKTVVIKKNSFEQVLREKQILYEAKHPFLVGLNYAFMTSAKLCLVMPFEE